MEFSAQPPGGMDLRRCGAVFGRDHAGLAVGPRFDLAMQAGRVRRYRYLVCGSEGLNLTGISFLTIRSSRSFTVGSMAEAKPHLPRPEVGDEPAENLWLGASLRSRALVRAAVKGFGGCARDTEFLHDHEPFRPVDDAAEIRPCDLVTGATDKQARLLACSFVLPERKS